MDILQSNAAKRLYVRRRYQRWDTQARRLAVRCPWCGKLIPDRQGDVHHWLIKRSAIPKSQFERINQPQNLILLHHTCHIKYGQTHEMFERCKAAALEVFSPEELTEFYNSLSDIGVRTVVSVQDI